jgi:hypothetical protein
MPTWSVDAVSERDEGEVTAATRASTSSMAGLFSGEKEQGRALRFCCFRGVQGGEGRLE